MIFKTLALIVGIFASILQLQAGSIAPDHEAIRYTGRFTENYRFGWTGSLIETEFTGSNISAKLRLTEGQAAGLTIIVDGDVHYLKVTRGQELYSLAENLQPGSPHKIGIFKRSEGSIGTVQFLGFETSDDGTLSAVPASPRKMLVIGDSITCGYGNEAETIQEGNTVDNENGYMSYAAIAARELDADLMMVCWSGRGMFRNRSPRNDQVGTLPQLFEQTLPNNTEQRWDHAKFIPDAIIINLGTNDSADLNGKKEPLNKDDFCQTYSAFIKHLRDISPKSDIFLCIGPMQSGEVSSWLPEIASEFENTQVLVFTPFAGKQDIGGHYHPSVLKDQKMADQLTAAIRPVLNW